MTNFNFRKALRLRHRNLVSRLFERGEGFSAYPLRMVALRLTPEELDAAFRCQTPKGIAPVQMMVTVPKRKIRHAVDRVLLRRRIREAYRLGRAELMAAEAADPATRVLCIAFIYLADEVCDYHRIAKQMAKLLAKIPKTCADS